MLKKLRLKFILITMGIVATMLVVIFSTVYHFTKSDLEKQSISMLSRLSQSPQQPVGMWQEDIQLPHFMIHINPDGDITTSGHTYYDLNDEAFIQELIQQVYAAREHTGVISGYDLRYARVTGKGSQRLIFLDVSSQRAALSALVQVSLLIGVGSLIVFLGISIFLARWAVKPVEKAWQQQRQFVSDASHELKTPLTVIMSNAELLQSDSFDQAERGQFAQNILTMSQRMRSLVDGMLELARADNGQKQNTYERLDYSKLVSDVLLPFEPVLFERGLLLESAVESGIAVTGSAQHLQQVVGVLLDNAAKYAQPGVVSVSLQRQGRNQCLLSVSNPGQPIAQEDLERIFLRFYRGDQSRTGTGSYGLGLSIARSIVQDHRGKIWAESNDTGNCFFVQLPLA